MKPQVDEKYLKTLESEIDRLEEEISRLNDTYFKLALTCAKGKFQELLIKNESEGGWNKHARNLRGYPVLESRVSKKNLFKRITEADVAHLRLVPGSETLVTAYGPPPTGVKTRKFEGMTYYVY